MGTALFLSLRVAHVLSRRSLGRRNGLYVAPADAGVEGSGPDRAVKSCRASSSRGMTRILRPRRHHRPDRVLSLLAFHGRVDPEVSRNHAGMAFGLAAWRSGGRDHWWLRDRPFDRGRVRGVMEQLPKARRLRKPALMQEAAGLRGRMKTFGTVVLLLQVVALRAHGGRALHLMQPVSSRA